MNKYRNQPEKNFIQHFSVKVNSHARRIGHVACIGVIRKAHNILVKKSEGRTQLKRPGCYEQDNIKMHIRCRSLDWIHMAQNRNQG